MLIITITYYKYSEVPHPIRLTLFVSVGTSNVLYKL